LFCFRNISDLEPGSRILDLGGVKTLKRGAFDIDESDLDVVSLNLSVRKKADVQGDAEALPFENDSFDAVLCSELLEHVPSPPKVLNEVQRVLRNGGVFLGTVPFMYRIHADPFDYGRYTDFYWKEVLEKAGYKDIKIEKQGLFWSVLAEMVRGRAALMFNEGWFGFGIGKRILAISVTRLERWAVNRDSRTENKSNLFMASYTTGFGIKAIK